MKGRIEIKSLEEGLKDFRATWKAVAAGKKVTPRRGTYFTSLEAARKRRQAKQNPFATPAVVPPALAN